MSRLNPLRDALHHTVAIVCMAIIALLAACSCGSIHTRTTWEHGYNFDNGNPHYGHYKNIRSTRNIKNTNTTITDTTTAACRLISQYRPKNDHITGRHLPTKASGVFP